MRTFDMINQVKPLERLPAIELPTIKMVANYFEASEGYVRSLCYGKGFARVRISLTEFIDKGYEVVSSNANKSTRTVKYEDYGFNVGNVGVACIPDETIIKIAYKLKNNSVAEKLRKIIEEKHEDVPAVESDDLTVREYNEQKCAAAEQDNKKDDFSGSNSLQVFSNSEFGSIRTVEINKEPWFVGKDVAEVLGYTDVGHAILDHVDLEDRVNSKTQGQNAPELGQRGSWLINESGLYSLILSSKQPSAKKFKRWVTSEVLPSIRKHGTYMTPETLEAAILNPDTMIKILQSLKDEQEKNKALTAELEIERIHSGNLSVANRAMTVGINKWESRSVLNALMRSLATRRFNGQFQYAFSNFYKQLKYKHHIDVKLRQAKDSKKSHKLLMDYIREDEMDRAVRLAVAICEDNGINTGKVINEVNSGRYSTSTVG